MEIILLTAKTVLNVHHQLQDVLVLIHSKHVLILIIQHQYKVKMLVVLNVQKLTIKLIVITQPMQLVVNKDLAQLMELANHVHLWL